jgi:PIN domain nuclease of toxin-antitoxin system
MINLPLRHQCAHLVARGRSRLSSTARETINSADSEIYVSAVSAWEIAIKVNAGKLNAPGDVVAQIDANGWHHLPITLQNAIAAGSLPRLHGDPFDRMLVAQAQVEGLTVVTRDPTFARYGVPVLRA